MSSSSSADDPFRGTFTPTRERLPSRLWSTLRLHGIGEIIARGKAKLSTRFWEWRLGIDTLGSIHGRELGSDDSSFGYQPIPYRSFESAMRHVDVRPSVDTFVDIGCGKGRAVVLAARLPFRRVVGVEISESLATVARNNLRMSVKFHRCPDVSVATIDARQFTPDDDISVVFFFNPFDDSIMRTVLEKFRSSWFRKRRPITFVYSRPIERGDLLATCDWLRPVEKCVEPHATWEQISIYRSAAE